MPAGVIGVVVTASIDDVVAGFGVKMPLAPAGKAGHAQGDRIGERTIRVDRDPA